MKHKVIVITFLAVLGAVFFLNLLTPPVEFSASERRRLARFPGLTAETVLNGKFFEGFDDFAVDQAAFREPFRRIKAFFDLNVLRKLDNNAIFVRNGHVFKTDYPVNEPSVLRLCGIINAVYRRYLSETNNILHTIVPDKNYHLGRGSGHLVMDYDKMESIINNALDDGIAYISLFDTLSLDSYYRTDSHWRQEKLFPVAERLAGAMDFQIPGSEAYTPHSFDRFFGVYYGQSALLIEPDELIWLVSDTTRRAVVTSIEAPGRRLPVYDVTQLGAVDPYSIFMSGPTAVVTAQNPGNISGRRLILFRDSFASALSPLLLDAYSEIILIDLRYIQPDMLGPLIDFAGADVLFIYSAGLYNNSSPVRGAVADSFVSPFVARGRVG
jgi:hypothetical protein